MISLQPFYIQGIRVQEAKESAFGAAGLFIVTFIASICWVYAERTRRTPDVVHAVDGEHDNYDVDPEEEHPSLHYSAAAEYDGESEYVQRAMVMSRTALRRFRQQRQERQRHQQHQQPTASIAAISLEMKSFEIRSRPSSSNAATNSGELL